MEKSVEIDPNRDYNIITGKENTKQFRETGHRIKQNADSTTRPTGLQSIKRNAKENLSTTINKEEIP